jgi:hypothetical protein
MKPMPIREFAAAFFALPSVSARTIWGPANTAPAAAKEDFKKRRRVECEEFFMVIVQRKKSMTPGQEKICRSWVAHSSASGSWILSVSRFFFLEFKKFRGVIITAKIQEPAQQFHTQEAVTESCPALSIFSAPL